MLLWFFSGDILLRVGLCTFPNSLSKSSLLMSTFVSVILQTFSSVSSTFLVTLLAGSSTPDITRHDLREHCLSLSTSVFSCSLGFVAVKLQDCASCSICSRLVKMPIFLSWTLIISRRSSTFSSEEEVVPAYIVVTGVSNSIVNGVEVKLTCF